MLLENVHKEDIMKRTAQMCKDNIVNVLLLLLFYHLSLIAGMCLQELVLRKGLLGKCLK